MKLLNLMLRSTLAVLSLILPGLVSANSKPTKIIKITCESKTPFASFKIDGTMFGDYNEKGRFIPRKRTEVEGSQAHIVIKDSRGDIMLDDIFEAEPGLSEFIINQSETLMPIIFYERDPSKNPRRDYYPKILRFRNATRPDDLRNPKVWSPYSDSVIYWHQSKPTYTQGRGEIPTTCESTLEDNN